MKTERILIYEDKGKKTDFVKSVNNSMQKANELIQNFNEFQDFKLITTLEDFENLYSDPLGEFDKTIVENIDIKAKGSKTPDPAVLSALFQIDRPGYMEAIGKVCLLKMRIAPTVQRKRNLSK